MKTGFIGCGNMGGTLARTAAKEAGGSAIFVADPDAKKTEAIQKEYGVQVVDTETLVQSCDVIFLGVKPQVLPAAAKEIRPVLTARTDAPLIVSMAAGVTSTDVSAMLGGARVLRIMPNIPCGVGEGVIFYATEGGATAEDEEAFTSLMKGAGLLSKIPENKIDAGSAITGCGPAFICLIAEALTDAGVRLGFRHDEAQAYALKMMLGTAKYALESGTDPATFRAQVCSPAGSTIEGVVALEKGGVRSSIIEAVQASYEKNKELGK